jgi:hypothetical protein
MAGVYWWPAALLEPAAIRNPVNYSVSCRTRDIGFGM